MSVVYVIYDWFCVMTTTFYFNFFYIEDTLLEKKSKEKKHGYIADWRLPGAFFHLWLSGTIKYLKTNKQKNSTRYSFWSY